jgi:hypothetical protein
MHKNTYEEYCAKALLLGYLYDERDHTFFTETGRLRCFDPETLEEVHTSLARSEKYKGYSYPTR